VLEPEQPRRGELARELGRAYREGDEHRLALARERLAELDRARTVERRSED
jgi:hypothetical protein